MSEKILTQQEIEALTQGLALDREEPAHEVAPDPTEAARRPKRYDFRRPDKFSKDHLRALRLLFAGYARWLASALTSHLRTHAQITLTMVEQVTYDEYLRSLPSPTVLFVTSMDPLPGQVLLEINLPVARVIIDRLLGGNGVVSGRVRDLTEIELTLLKTVGHFLLESFQETWSSITPIRPVAQDPSLTPEFVQITLSAETTAMLVFEINILKSAGTLSICLPHPVLQPVLDKLTSVVWYTETRPLEAEDQTFTLSEQLAPVTVPVIAELGHARLRVSELMELHPGQLIRLDSAANGDLPIFIGNRLKCRGRPGTIGRNLALQITQFVS